MTPLRFAQEMADDLATLPIVPPIHAQLGEVIIPCPGTIVSILTQTLIDPNIGAADTNCDKIEVADVSVSIARDCANVSNDDGSTNWDAQDAVSMAMDADGALLWEWAEKMHALAWWRQGNPTVNYTITGGLAITTLFLQLPVP